MTISIRETWKPVAQSVLWIVVYLAVAGFIGEMTRMEIPEWYRSLAKPPLNPPNYIFPIAWTTLYIMIALAGSRIWTRRKEIGCVIPALFTVQTLLNWGWSYAFFKYHLLGFSFAWIVLLVVFVAILIFLLRKNDSVSAWLLTPYLAWILFASYLNGMIWQLN